MLREVDHVLIVRRGDGEWDGLVLPLRSRSGIDPFAHGHVPVCKAEGACPIVIAGRVIDDHDSTAFYTIVHRHCEVGKIEAVRMFVDEHKGIGMPHTIDV